MEPSRKTHAIELSLFSVVVYLFIREAEVIMNRAKIIIFQPVH